MSETCSNCRFWAETLGGDGEDGRCQRHAPVVAVSIDPVYGYKPEGQHEMTRWPYASSENWCGDYERRD